MMRFLYGMVEVTIAVRNKLTNTEAYQHLHLSTENQFKKNCLKIDWQGQILLMCFAHVFKHCEDQFVMNNMFRQHNR